jgi:hypothetical protein
LQVNWAQSSFLCLLIATSFLNVPLGTVASLATVEGVSPITHDSVAHALATTRILSLVFAVRFVVRVFRTW